MMTDDELIARGGRVLALEREALAECERRLGASFAAAVRLLQRSRGRVIVAGIGKSGLIGRKIAATLTSTGTPASFLHPTESVHGDLGIIGGEDVAILLSKSGETTELYPLLEALRRDGVGIIAITGAAQSTLGRHADVVLDGWVREEACPHDLAPTTSTTVALALGDALAVALLEVKGFRREDFARLHPGGALGRRLLTTVADVMVTTPLPLLSPTATMREATVVLAAQRGLAVVGEPGAAIAGVITTGDLARLLRDGSDVLAIPVTEVMTRTPRTATAEELGSAVVHRMETHGIIAMPVLDEARHCVGVVHLHDLMRAGAS
jgi:arabinose-5-phosphate isomerase